jgi:hypothetical protein
MQGHLRSAVVTAIGLRIAAPTSPSAAMRHGGGTGVLTMALTAPVAPSGAGAPA